MNSPQGNCSATQESSPEITYRLEDYQFDLPPELIAQEPLPVRHQSRLMKLERSGGQISHHQFSNLVELLQPGDLLVINDTKVIPARLIARRASGGIVQILLLRPESTNSAVWHAMATPLRKLKAGEQLTIDTTDGGSINLLVQDIVQSPDGQKRLLLNLGSTRDVFTLLSKSGYAPLPPYIHRDPAQGQRNEDLQRYQTVFAQVPGAVAAPTAGLHFSPELLDALRQRNIQICQITLHVGPGTFKPITTTLESHTIESEMFTITDEVAANINKALAERRRVIAVGTTSCRALETAGMSGTIVPSQDSSTGLYIRPGYEFRVISGLITNFHLSCSSLLVLVSAFAGHQSIMQAYRQAIEERYRFFSYGDAMLIL